MNLPANLWYSWILSIGIILIIIPGFDVTSTGWAAVIGFCVGFTTRLFMKVMNPDGE